MIRFAGRQDLFRIVPTTSGRSQAWRAAVLTLCAGGTAPELSNELSTKRRRLRAYADNDPPFVVQDLDLPTPFALEFRHPETRLQTIWRSSAG
jgi:hypothetical protein